MGQLVGLATTEVILLLSEYFRFQYSADMKHRAKLIANLDGKLLIVSTFDCNVANGI